MIIKNLVKIQELSYLKANCNSLRFDGVNEDLLVTPTTNFNFQWTDAWSIEAWIYPPSTSSLKFAFSKWGGAPTLNIRGWFFMVLGYNPSSSLQGALRFQLRQAASGYIDAYSNSSINFDQWNHVVVTYDGSGTNAGITFYINNVATAKPNTLSTLGSGTPIGSGSISSGTIQTNEPTTVNSLVTNGSWVAGDLESTKVYNVELTAADIEDLYIKASIPKNQNLILDLNVGRSVFNGTEWEVPDVTGNNTAISRNMEVDDLTTNCPMKGVVPCRSLVFDGVNEFLDCTNNSAFDFSPTNAFSIESWIKFDNLTGARFIVSKWTRPTFNDVRAYTLQTLGNNFRFLFGSSNTSLIIVSSTQALSTGVWYHILLTYDGSNDANGVKFYIDNNLSGKTIDRNDLTGVTTNTEPLQIGGQDTFFSAAQIAKTRMWDVELSASDVNTQWNGGVIQNTPVQSGNLVLNTNIDNSSFGTQWTIPDLTGTTGGYTSVNMEESDRVDECPIRSVVPCYSLDFDGVNEYVNCTDNNAFSFGAGGSDSPFSMTVWINMDDATNCRMMSKFISVGGREYWFGTTSDDTILFALYNSFSDTRFVYVKSTVPLNENTWINVTVTYDGRGGLTAFDGQEIYVDGQLQSKTTAINGNYQSMSNKSAPLEIGAITSLGNYANAKFASARMWNVELSASETLAYYNETNAATSIQTSALVVDADFNASVFNGSEFNIPDPTGITSGYTSVNLEIEDKVEDCPS